MRLRKNATLKETIEKRRKLDRVEGFSALIFILLIISANKYLCIILWECCTFVSACMSACLYVFLCLLILLLILLLLLSLALLLARLLYYYCKILVKMLEDKYYCCYCYYHYYSYYFYYYFISTTTIYKMTDVPILQQPFSSKKNPSLRI